VNPDWELGGDNSHTQRSAVTRCDPLPARIEMQGTIRELPLLAVWCFWPAVALGCSWPASSQSNMAALLSVARGGHLRSTRLSLALVFLQVRRIYVSVSVPWTIVPKHGLTPALSIRHVPALRSFLFLIYLHFTLLSLSS
jgi:hypothetical protein